MFDPFQGDPGSAFNQGTSASVFRVADVEETEQKDAFQKLICSAASLGHRAEQGQCRVCLSHTQSQEKGQVVVTAP